jgi:fatty-acid desaturase
MGHARITPMMTSRQTRIVGALGMVATLLYAAFALHWHLGFDCFYFRSASHGSLYAGLALAWLVSICLTAVTVSGRFRFWRPTSLSA